MKISGSRDSGGSLNQLKTLFSWWKSELIGMTPAFTGRKSGSVDNLLLALFKDDAITFFWHDSSQWRELGRAHGDSTQAELADRLNAIRKEKHITIARLPAGSILQRRLDLPIAAENELRQILSYQLDSLSPYPPDQIYFSYRILERDYAGKKLVIELSLAPRDEVDRLVGRLRSWDLVPEFVDFVDKDEFAEPVVNLLPNPLAPVKQQPALSSVNRLLLALNVLLAAAFIISALMGRANLEAELKTRVETAKLRADAAIRLREKVETLQAESTFLQNKKEQYPPVLELLDELSGILPDETWLEKAVYNKREITMSGISSKASVLISEIERSPRFENVAFQASVVRDDRSGGERFQIRADVTGVDTGVE